MTNARRRGMMNARRRGTTNTRRRGMLSRIIAMRRAHMMMIMQMKKVQTTWPMEIQHTMMINTLT
jgi:hypothetical protein